MNGLLTKENTQKTWSCDCEGCCFQHYSEEIHIKGKKKQKQPYLRGKMCVYGRTRVFVCVCNLFTVVFVWTKSVCVRGLYGSTMQEQTHGSSSDSGGCCTTLIVVMVLSKVQVFAFTSRSNAGGGGSFAPVLTIENSCWTWGRWTRHFNMLLLVY